MDWPVPPPPSRRGRPKKKPGDTSRDGRLKGTPSRTRRHPDNPYSVSSGKCPTSKQILEGARRRAALSGDLPHEFLLKIMRGDMVWHDGVKIRPSLEMRIDCAKAAAPFYAPKLAQVNVTESMSDADLEFIIKSAASEAGIGISFGGEVEAGSESTLACAARTTH